jgi:hypothetical protein
MEPNLVGYTVIEADLQGVIEAQSTTIATLQKNHAVVLRALGETQQALMKTVAELEDLKSQNDQPLVEGNADEAPE